MRLNEERVTGLKREFPILDNGVVYLDNASTAQKPRVVIDTMTKYYEKYNANVHRGVYKLSNESTSLYNSSRKVVAEFIGAKEKEIVFTRGTTESINLLARTLGSIIPKGKNDIVVFISEHHSNFLPWMELSKRLKFRMKVINVDKFGSINIKEAKKVIGEKTAIVAVAHVTNSFGTVNPIDKILKLARKRGAVSVVDAAQSIPRMKTDVKSMNCDFLAFSGHKMMGPTGIGVLYGREELLEKLEPYEFGGGMIERVFVSGVVYAQIPERFEAGTPNISGAIGLARAVRFIQSIGIENIERWEDRITKYALRRLESLKEVSVYGKNNKGIISFNVEGIHPHDISTLMDMEGICIRGGHHCAMPLMKEFGINGTCRISFYFYNTHADVDKFIRALEEIVEKFKNVD